MPELLKTEDSDTATLPPEGEYGQESIQALSDLEHLRLRPGMYVHILGLRPPFDGFYYVVKTVHSLDETGYRTGFTLRRPGMLPPSAYLNDSTEEIAEAAERRQLEASRAAAAAGGAR